MTLIEAMVWIAVSTAAMVALVSSTLYFYRTNEYGLRQADAVASAEHSMDIVVKALRTASYANNGAYPIVSIAPNDIVFYASVTKGSPYTQKVHFYTQGTSLFEGVIEPSGDPPVYTGGESTTTLSTYVQNITAATSTFVYYDQSGTQITDYSKFASVRFVVINLVVDANTTALPTQLVLTSSAALRNLITH